ncbi:MULTISPECIES: DUF2218 domain-containing protein [Raoultella]|uniref:DUF2218 domain-containing protein n=1 Tax=Raoultella lignicola TaxID=3040939 RepID=A0ABU9FA61_9ENTR|nr:MULTISPECIES: DUF2218 domain-containing protein [unclassified Raoultella]MRT48605.1 DUF2218 domain-containing protein [Raoultella sp. RIT712]ROS15687.1 DNA-binding PadR family transcriptional regulator [Raoultella sp. BIGb0399]
MEQTQRSGKKSADTKTSTVPQNAGQTGRRGRVFDYGELRVLLLAMLSEQPSHGYELIHDIKERFGGLYKPSPGVIYPTLTWLYDRNYAVIDLEKGGRKRYSITDEGQAWLTANQSVMDMLKSRVAPQANRVSPPVMVEAMDHLKRALSLRIKYEPLPAGMIDSLAQAIHLAAERIEHLLTTPVPAEGLHSSIAHITTPNAPRFMRRLCSHFQHRTPVVSDENSGQFRLSIGDVRLDVLDNALQITLTASETDDLAEMETILERHLAEAAVRETLDIRWQRS